jgi:hypothetical protein
LRAVHGVRVKDLRGVMAIRRDCRARDRAAVKVCLRCGEKKPVASFMRHNMAGMLVIHHYCNACAAPAEERIKIIYQALKNHETINT